MKYGQVLQSVATNNFYIVQESTEDEDYANLLCIQFNEIEESQPHSPLEFSFIDVLGSAYVSMETINARMKKVGSIKACLPAGRKGNASDPKCKLMKEWIIEQCKNSPNQIQTRKYLKRFCPDDFRSVYEQTILKMKKSGELVTVCSGTYQYKEQ